MLAKKMPSEITIVVILEVVGSMFMLIAGVATGMFSWSVSGIIFPDRIGRSTNLTLFAVVIGLVVIVALIHFFTAWGLCTRKGWAWTLNLILAVLGVTGSLLTLSIGIIGIIIHGTIIYYLTRPRIKALFGKEAPKPATTTDTGPI